MSEANQTRECIRCMGPTTNICTCDKCTTAIFDGTEPNGADRRSDWPALEALRAKNEELREALKDLRSAALGEGILTDFPELSERVDAALSPLLPSN
jgi:hypothetical protein